ncbi:MAG: hypothetical protein K2P99_03925 [Burkholderiales bacterium]|nr:hypothetical protein [Burkholderiales bacterium]
MKHLALLQRDVEIIEFVAKFAYCQDRHIQKLCNLTPQYYLKVIKRLVDADLVVRSKILAYTEPYISLSKAGAKFLSIANISKPVLNTLYHDTLLIDLYFKLQESYPHAKFRTDKEIRRELAIHDANETIRIPDLLINDHLAIELELSEKPLARLNHIINTYIIDNNMHEVHYYLTSTRLFAKISSLTNGSTKFKFSLLELEEGNKTIRQIAILTLGEYNYLSHIPQEPKKFGAYTYMP